MDKGRPPGRLRHSYSARCRLVSLVLSGLSPQAASRACGMSRATAYRLLRRYQQEGGWEALRDRPPIAGHHPHRLSMEAECRSWSCGGVLGGGRKRYRRRLVGRHRRSGGCCAGMTAHTPPASRGQRRIAMSTPPWESSCIWTSRSWAVSGRSGNASTVTAASAADAPAGAMPTWPLTTIRATPSSSCAAQSAAVTAPPSPSIGVGHQRLEHGATDRVGRTRRHVRPRRLPGRSRRPIPPRRPASSASGSIGPATASRQSWSRRGSSPARSTTRSTATRR